MTDSNDKPADVEGSAESHCSAAFDDMLPAEVRDLVGQCEAGVQGFDNDEMSVALKFGEMLWRRLARVADHYELQAHNLVAGDIRRLMLLQATLDMRHVLNDTRQDL